MAEVRPSRLTEAFFGRRRGKTLSALQIEQLAGLLPRLKLDLKNPSPACLQSIFGAPVARIRLEIGFGGGEHLMHRALEQPDTGFIGVEPFVNSMAKLLARVDETNAENIRVHDDDAAELLDWLPPSSIDQIDLLYPDPWHKKKHWKRRFVSEVNLSRFVRILKPGGLFCFASDIEHYVNWTLDQVERHGGLGWMANNAADWHRPFENWPGTRYEDKAKREGRASAYLTFIKA